MKLNEMNGVTDGPAHRSCAQIVVHIAQEISNVKQLDYHISSTLAQFMSGAMSLQGDVFFDILELDQGRESSGSGNGPRVSSLSHRRGCCSNQETGWTPHKRCLPQLHQSALSPRNYIYGLLINNSKYIYK